MRTQKDRPKKGWVSSWILASYPLRIFTPPQLDRPIMSTTGNISRIRTDIDTKNVTRMSAQRSRQAPVVGGEDVDVFVEAARDEECACFLGGDLRCRAVRFGIGVNRWFKVGWVTPFIPSEIRHTPLMRPHRPYRRDFAYIPAFDPSVSAPAKDPMSIETPIQRVYLTDMPI